MVEGEEENSCATDGAARPGGCGDELCLTSAEKQQVSDPEEEPLSDRSIAACDRASREDKRRKKNEIYTQTQTQTHTSENKMIGRIFFLLLLSEFLVVVLVVVLVLVQSHMPSLHGTRARISRLIRRARCLPHHGRRHHHCTASSSSSATTTSSPTAPSAGYHKVWVRGIGF